MRRSWLAALGAAAIVLGGAAPTPAAAEEPLWEFVPSQFYSSPPAPPVPDFEGPCGLAVDTVGNFYVADYYHHLIDVFDSGRGFITQLKEVDPLDGPCGLALDAAGDLYVNNYHRNVEKFVPSSYPPVKGSSFPFVAATSYASAAIFDSAHPTGVAVDRAGGAVYVNRRTEVAAYEASGAPLLDGEGQPLLIGAGALGDAYGLAVSGHPATAGRVYVADAADGTVKAFDPAIDPDLPADEISGADLPGGGFASLRDSALAVDDASGELYVADVLGPSLSEAPKARIQVFDAAGAHLGQLKHDVVDGSPVGLAVDNSAGPTQGRVYVTSGNGAGGSVFAYPPGAAVAPDPSPGGTAGLAASGGGASSSAVEPRGDSGPSGEAGAAARASAETVQKGTLRLRVSGRLAPKRLPRRAVAPVAVSVGGEVTTTDGSRPPQLRSMRIELNRQGRLRTAGLPTCPHRAIQPASSSRALSACRDALVGKGRFSLDVTLSGQEPYETGGRLLLFNGRRGKRPVLFGHIYSQRPFATSFVIVFSIQRIARGRYGTALSASLPKALGSWGNLTGIEMTLGRRYRHRGRALSYLSAGCPAPKGFPGAIFALARSSFAFAGGTKLSSVLTGECRVRRGS